MITDSDPAREDLPAVFVSCCPAHWSFDLEGPDHGVRPCCQVVFFESGEMVGDDHGELDSTVIVLLRDNTTSIFVRMCIEGSTDDAMTGGSESGQRVQLVQMAGARSTSVAPEKWITVWSCSSI